MSDHLTRLNKRDITTVEFLNSFFITVILYLHHSMYTIYHLKLLPTYHLNLFLQKMAVGGFFFLSGLKLTQSKYDTPLGSFLTNRFFRIYLLYFLAVISYSLIVYPYLNLGRFPALKNVIIHALGIQSVFPNFFGSTYLTIWFISILFLCYLFFMLTRKTVRKNALFIMVLGTAILIILAIHNFGKRFGILLFQEDICVYLVYYGLGMLYAVNRENTEKIKNGILFFALVFGLVGSLCFITYKPQIWARELMTIVLYILSNISMYILIFKVFQKYEPSKQIRRLIQYMSFASFCVFLFHRPIWSIMNLVWFNESFLHSLYIIILGSACMFVCCFRLQNGYNHLIQKLGYV